MAKAATHKTEILLNIFVQNIVVILEKVSFERCGSLAIDLVF